MLQQTAIMGHTTFELGNDLKADIEFSHEAFDIIMKDLKEDWATVDALNSRFLEYAGVYNVNVNTVDEYAVRLENFKAVDDELQGLND
jgi:tRNA A58 N-methylase Trm61